MVMILFTLLLIYAGCEDERITLRGTCQGLNTHQDSGKTSSKSCDSSALDNEDPGSTVVPKGIIVCIFIPLLDAVREKSKRTLCYSSSSLFSVSSIGFIVIIIFHRQTQLANEAEVVMTK
ncbi:hypothetical protein MG293_009405 [Ovis ammon polii]|uniref:Uncharacterized protein n=1 Tax=Ovis ammon polii TaxID=230172 RepID=A0AAD4U9V9_OVIAM|nr:hypothetical protein MG293_009405 [Ovis ammon polii]